MNQKIGMTASIVNAAAVGIFALSMLIGSTFLSYLSSMFIALSFVPMMCAFCFYARKERKVAGIISVGFSAIYAAIILLVYFAQLTTLRLDSLTDQAIQLLDFQKFGLFFSYDMLGYALMALSTFFAGLTLSQNKWLKALLMIHGIFFISCLIIPMLGIFSAEGDPIIGVVVLETWCIYFIPVGILSYRFFKNSTCDVQNK